MTTTKIEKRRRRKATKGGKKKKPVVSNLQKATPTSLLLERQAVGTLIKNHSTAGLPVNQIAYERYNQLWNARDVYARHRKPDQFELAGKQAQHFLRQSIQVPGHGGRRQTSAPLVRADAGTNTLEDDVRDQHDDASPQIERELTFDERFKEEARTAQKITDSPVTREVIDEKIYVSPNNTDLKDTLKAVIDDVFRETPSPSTEEGPATPEEGPATPEKGPATPTATPTIYNYDFETAATPIDNTDEWWSDEGEFNDNKNFLDINPDDVIETPENAPRVTRQSMGQQQKNNEEETTPLSVAYEAL